MSIKSTKLTWLAWLLQISFNKVIYELDIMQLAQVVRNYVDFEKDLGMINKVEVDFLN